MRFLADMGVSQRVTAWLRAGGHDAVHLRDERLHRLEDARIFGKAADEQRILLTFDLDFGEILALSRDALATVILFRLRNTTTAFAIRRLAAALAEASESLRPGVVVVVEDFRIRIRRLRPD